ncbi:hypothetical protein GW626_02135 [Peribacillus muralis]|uniref:hypothetical protein n=1 Tax=Peribacillus muralis TaxID=264697 RepID=UPI001F4E90C5|nr:hypothetical protein [Peribacillus muralis]MCK1994128.1 hypothetical protein [Peribacillus muralis]MCK2014683.1 hypothetical protein [Peribacillus muralis]
MLNESHKKNNSSYLSLKTLYEENITVKSIAQELEFCHENDEAMDIRKALERKNFDIMAVQDQGEIIGYIERQELGEGTISKYLKYFSPRELVSDSTPLIQLLRIFKNKTRVFVLENNSIKKLITHADLQKPPIRMLIFGYITLLEMRLSDIILHRFGDGNWHSMISEDRLEKANELYRRRIDKNEDINIIECLQISDKFDIIHKDQEMRRFFQIPSKSKGRKDANAIRKLRDKISHANELGLDMSWMEIIEVVECCGHLLEISESYQYER